MGEGAHHRFWVVLFGIGSPSIFQVLTIEGRMAGTSWTSWRWAWLGLVDLSDRVCGRSPCVGGCDIGISVCCQGPMPNSVNEASGPYTRNYKSVLLRTSKPQRKRKLILHHVIGALHGNHHLVLEFNKRPICGLSCPEDQRPNPWLMHYRSVACTACSNLWPQEHDRGTRAWLGRLVNPATERATSDNKTRKSLITESLSPPWLTRGSRVRTYPTSLSRLY